MRKIPMLILSALMASPASAAQFMSPHEKVSEIYKLLELCPEIRLNEKALSRFAFRNGIDLTPGSRDQRWFVRRAAYDIRKIRGLDNRFICMQGIADYGPDGGLARGIVSTE